VRSRENGSRLVRQALKVLTDAFPRSPQFWHDRIGPLLGRWPAMLQESAIQQWPGLARATISSAEAKRLYEEQEKSLNELIGEKENEIAALRRAVQDRDARMEELSRRLQEMTTDREKLRKDYNRLRQEAQEKIDKLMERIKELNQRLMGGGKGGETERKAGMFG
jgi:TolA-binding protein